MTQARTHHEPEADRSDRPAASLPVRLLVMGLLFALSILAIWSIDSRILHTMAQHSPTNDRAAAEQ